jgi:hypothetical protein
VGLAVLAAVPGCSSGSEGGSDAEASASAPAQPVGGPISDGVVPKEPQTPVELPSTGYGPGDLAARSTLTGEVALSPDGCVVSRSAADSVALLWPAGWTAQLGDDGRTEILDPKGTVVLHEGDTFEAPGGTYQGKSTWQCRPDSEKTFAMDGVPHKTG